MGWTEWYGILSTAGVATMALMKFRQAQKVDAISAQSGVASNHRAGFEQVIKATNDLLNQFQEENARLRLEAETRATRIDALTREVTRLRRKHGNGEENL